MNLLPIIFVMIKLSRGGQGYYVEGGKHSILRIRLPVEEYVSGTRVGFEHVHLLLLPIPRKQGVGILTIRIVWAAI